MEPELITEEKPKQEVMLPSYYAKKIYEEFILFESVRFEGYYSTPSETKKFGEMVLDEIRKLDIEENFEVYGGYKSRRKRKMFPSSIGGPIAYKAFRYKSETRNGIPTTVIWRVQ